MMAVFEAGRLSDPSCSMRWPARSAGALGVGLVFIMLAVRESEEEESSEFMASLLLIVSGMMLLSVAGDLVTVFAALEMISIPTYVILYLGAARTCSNPPPSTFS